MTFSFRGNQYNSARLVRQTPGLTVSSTSHTDVLTGKRLTMHDMQYADLILKIEGNELNVLKDRRGVNGRVDFISTGDELSDVAKILLLF